MARRLSGREWKLVAKDPQVTALVRERRDAVDYWSDRIAALEAERDRDLRRLDGDIEAAEVAVARELLDDPADDRRLDHESVPFDDEFPWRRPWPRH